MIFVKVAGGVITTKKPFTVNWTGINTIIKGLQELEEEAVIGHGGGSFSQTIEAEYEGTREGFFKIRESMDKLNYIFVSSCVAKGVDAVGFSPNSFAISKGGTIKKFFFEPIVEASKNYHPIIHRGAVLDTENLWQVFKVDELFYELAKHIKPRKFLIANDHEITSDGEAVNEIADWNFRDVVKGLDETDKQQVMDAARFSSRYRIEVHIFDGTIPGNIKRAWKFGEGTRVQVTRLPKDLSVL